MSSARRTLGALAALLPLGALGISTALAATPAPSATDSALERPGVAERLAAIRSAVSEMTADPSMPQPGAPGTETIAWHNWANFGPWGNGGWKNWGNGWHNGGWFNGGWNNWNNWKNGGWKNFWANW
jgi:rSAM-associated Gly-rich repeat protein